MVVGDDVAALGRLICRLTNVLAALEPSLNLVPTPVACVGCNLRLRLHLHVLLFPPNVFLRRQAPVSQHCHATGQTSLAMCYCMHAPEKSVIHRLSLGNEAEQD